MTEPQVVTSRENPLLKRLRQLVHDSTAYRKLDQVWLEGDHLCRSLLAHGRRPDVGVFSESGWRQASADLRSAAHRNVLVSDTLMADVSALESPSGMGYLWSLPTGEGLDVQAPTVVLDRLQDAGNVGSILRSAAAFGFQQALALKGTAALWSPKVVRAGMGAHFGLRLREGLSLHDLGALKVPLLVTSSHRGVFLHQAKLPFPCAWVLGHEGQGVSPELMARASETVRIAQPGGEESLNAAAAAAVCLHASAVSALVGADD